MLAALIELRGRRALLLDGSSTELLVELSELTTGFMRQRIDILLATSRALAAIPVEFRSRWRIADVLAVPDSDRYPQISLEGRELHVGDVTISAERVIFGEWEAYRPRAESDWLVSVTHATARLVVASSSFALEHFVPVSGSVTAAICTDDKVERWPAKGSTGILVAPPEARVFDEKEPTSERVYIPFHQRYPMTFGLLTDGIELPTSY